MIAGLPCISSQHVSTAVEPAELTPTVKHSESFSVIGTLISGGGTQA